MRRSIGFSAAAAPIVALVASLTAAAATGPVPVDVTPLEQENALWPVLVVIGAVGVLVGLTILLRPGWRRPIVASVVVLVSSIAALVLVAGGFFSDFSGDHAVLWHLVVAGVGVLVGGIYAAIRIARGGMRPADTSIRG